MIELIITVAILVAVVFIVKRVLTPPGSSNRFEKAAVRKPASPAVSSPTTGADGKRKPLIMYGSQTGTAELFAKTLHREAHRQGIDFNIIDAEEYSTNSLADERLIVFVVSTYGEGEPTDSARNFHEYLMDKDSRFSGEMESVKYCVFGLGDRQYPKFCQAAVDIDEAMSEYGATRIYGLGMGDAGRDLEEEWDTWRVDVWGSIATALDIKLKLAGDEPVLPELTMKKFPAAAAAEDAFPRMSLGLEPTNRQPAFVKMAENTELLNGAKDRSTRHIAFTVTGTSLSYQAGDHLGVLPHNPDDIVEDYIKALHLDEEEVSQVFALLDDKKKSVLPAKVTVRTALKWYVDLCGAPKKSALRAFTHYCSDEKEKAEFQSLLLVNHEAQAKYHTFVKSTKTVLGVLSRFKSCRVPIAHFLELMPRIAPRYFSISSDQLRTPDKIFITVAHVKGGLCTTMLLNMKPGDLQPVFVRKSNFHLPMRRKTRPIIMIGPGTGVAPLIGFAHRRFAWKDKNQEIGPALLFFGCRNKSEDFIYEDFLKKSQQEGVLSELIVAFSRDQAEKRYVQHDIADRASQIWSLLSEGANLYICGDAKHMAKDVEATIKKIIMTEGGQTGGQAEAFLDKMLKEERFLKDVWSA